jgi:hypothetical protein
MKLALSAALLGIVVAAGPACAATWDADDDFSIAANPNGAWSYGYRDGGLAFVPYTASGTFGGIPFWFFGAGLPDVGKWGVDDLRFHPGNTAALANYASVVRWTAPAAGRYALTTEFEGADTRGVSTIVSVLRNGASIFTDFIVGLGDIAAFAASYDMAAADSLEFIVANNGAVGDRNFTQLTAIIESVAVDPVPISAVPVPGSLAILLGAAAGLAGLRRRSNTAHR